MAKVIIFGVLDFAALAYFYLKHDSSHEVVAFSVDKKYLPLEQRFQGLPVVPFEEIEQVYNPSDYYFFAPMSPRKMNSVRESVYRQILGKKYRMISYVSSKATVFSNLKLGDNCFILENNTLQPFVEIGHDVVLWSGNHIGHHSVIKEHVFFTSHVVLSGHCLVEPYAFFGVNATVRDNVHIAEGSLIGMGASIHRDTEPWGVYKGTPARKAKKLSHETDF